MSRNAEPANPIRALVDEYNKMCPEDGMRRIAHVILSNIRNVPGMTLERAAELCSVSTSTFSRFCRHMGYASYSDFKYRVSDELSAYIFKNVSVPKSVSVHDYESMDGLIRMLKMDLDNLNKSLNREKAMDIVKKLHASEKIFIHDISPCGEISSLQSALAYDGKEVFFSSDNHAQREDTKLMGPRDMLLINYNGTDDGKHIVKNLAYAKLAGIYIAAIAPSTVFPNHVLCDTILKLGMNMSAFGCGVAGNLAYTLLSIIYKGMYISAPMSEVK